MDEKLKIKISIADRVYPLTVELNQEEGLRRLLKKIDVMSNLKKTMLSRQTRCSSHVCVAICITIRAKNKLIMQLMETKPLKELKINALLDQYLDN
jgi:cell division protein ZapA